MSTEGRLWVDFNEMMDDDLVLLSKSDIKQDVNGSGIALFAGKIVQIYDEDFNDEGERDDLWAKGEVELNPYYNTNHWSARAKWCCRIDQNGIRNASDCK